jgi:hypothetical protein
MQAQGNGIYVEITTNGHITTSVDSINWIPAATAFSPAGISPFTSKDAYWSYNGIVFGSGYFVAYGNHIVIVSTALPGSSWVSVLTTGGNWISATFNGTTWLLTDDEGRTATSYDYYPANWFMTRATISSPPTFVDSSENF